MNTSKSTIMLTSIAERIPLGERIKAGDWWYYQAINKYFVVKEPKRNWLGKAEKITKQHAPHFRITQILRPNT